ncbi:MAG: tetratricopeptide repeat protein [Ferruginibacter sp.]
MATYLLPVKRYRLFLLLLTASCYTSLWSQPLPDSVLSKFKSTATHKSKDDYLWNYLQSLSKDSNEVTQALRILSYFKDQDDKSSAANTESYIALRLGYKGDYITALNMGLAILADCEKRKDTLGIIHSFQVIHYSFSLANNYEEAIAWQKKAIPYALAIRDESKLADIYNNIGAVYAQAMMPDSGLVYAQKAVNIDTRSKDVRQLPYSLSTLAENYLASEDFDLALPFLRKSLVYAESNGDSWATAYTFLDFAQAYYGLKNYDSSIYYARKSVELSNYMGFKETLLKSCEALYKSFEATGREDSLNKYFRLATVAKDSIYSTKKTSNIQAISFREQLRQQEIETEKTKTEEERQDNIQFAAIAIGILTFIILFLLLSRSIIVNEKWISFFGVLGLLVVFEFINLLIHPALVRVTNHSPVLMLLALVLIASMLIPLHHRMEKWINEKMTEKNKRLRLENAKRTIEKLG